MKIEVNISKTYLFIIVGAILVLTGSIYVYALNPSLPWHEASQVKYNGGDLVTKLVSLDNEMIINHPGGGTVTLKEFIKLTTILSSPINVSPVKNDLKCPEGYAVYTTTIESSNSGSKDIIFVTCRKIEFNNRNCTSVIFADGGSNVYNNEWNTQCGDDYYVNEIVYDAGRAKSITCCKSSKVINTNNCSVAQEGRDSNKVLPDKTLVAIYDDDNYGNDIDYAKFCSVVGWSPRVEDYE